MNYTEFNKKIKSEKLLSAYIFMGEESLLMDKSLSKLKELYIEPGLEDLNYIVFNRKNLNFDHILNACETLPFMAEKKVIVIKNIGELMENDKDFDQKLGHYIANLGDYLCLLVMTKPNELKKTSSLYKNVKKYGQVVEFDKLKGKDLSTWIEGKFKEKGKNIQASDLSYFISQSSYSDYNSSKNLHDLENEINKIISFANEENIKRENIDEVLTRTLDTNIFNLLSAINTKDRDRAIKVLNELYIVNEPIQRILFMITRQIRLMLAHKLYKARGDSEAEIQKKLQIGNFEHKKISRESANFTSENLTYALERVLQTDIKQKTSSYDEKLALEMLIIELSYKM